MKESVILLHKKHRDRLGTVRTIPNWKAAADGNNIWLRGPVDNGKAQSALKSLPADATYLMDGQFRLFPNGKQTPVLVLKDIEWQNLSDFFPVSLPVSAMPGATPGKIKVQLTRSSIPQPAFALMTSKAVWKTYVESAPLIRLQHLKFAVSGSDGILVVGQPLPPIKGPTYWLNKNILLPVGYDFDPPIIVDLIAGDELTLFFSDGRKETIPQSCFNPAERNLMRQHG